MNKWRLITLGCAMVILLLLFVFSRRGMNVRYQSQAVSGTVVDAKTAHPMAGVTVTVTWGAMRSTANMHDPESMCLHSASVVTDSNGVFTVPAWGPETLDWGWFYFSSDPEATFSMDGHALGDPIHNKNHAGLDEIQPWPLQTITFEEPSWNGQRISR